MKHCKGFRLVALALVVLMCLAFVSCSPNGKDLDFEVNLKILQGGGFEIDGYTCRVTGIGSFEGNDLEIPSKHKFNDVFWEWLKPGLPYVTWDRIPLLLEYLKNWEVTEISGSAFKNCTQLESVEMPDTITEIGDEAFAGCSNLKTIVLSENLSAIGSNAFDGCPTELFTEYEGAYYLGNESNPYQALIRAIDTSVTSVKIHEETILIAEAAFEGCGSVTDLLLPNASIIVPANTFESCTNLQNVQLPVAEGLAYVLNPDGTSYSVSGVGSCKLVYFSIPTEHEGLPVTGIADGAFSYDYEKWEKLAKQYKKYAKDCKAEGITDKEQIRQGFIERFGEEYFLMQQSALIEMVALHANITSVGENAFTSCRVFVSQDNADFQSKDGCLIHVPTKTLLKGSNAGTIPEGVVTIGDDAFNNLGVVSIVIPNGVTSIGERAFYGCTLLESVTIPDSVTSIGVAAFSGCDWLQSVSLGNGVTSIGAAAFAGCESLTSIEIPDGVTRIESETFMSCGSLESVGLPDSLSYIGNDAFKSCTSLELIVIPKNVTGIGSTAFESSAMWFVQCLSAIDRDELNAAFPPCVLIVDGDNNLLTQSFSNSKYVLTEDGFFYNKYDEDGEFDQSSYTLYAYIGSENTVTLPLTIEDNAYEIVGFGTFAENVVIPDGFEVIGDSAFTNCDELKSITIPDSVMSIGEHAFSGCAGLTSLVIPDSVTRIGNDAFAGCSGLTSVTIGNGVEDLSVFYFSANLTEVVIGNGVQSIDDETFKDCTGLKSVTIGNGVTSIGNEAFAGCSGLTEVVIPDSVTSIGNDAFAGCSGLTSVTIGNGVTSIGDRAFVVCSGLTSVVIPDSVTSPVWAIFEECVALKDVYYCGSEEQWTEFFAEASVPDTATVHYNYIPEQN